MTRDELKAWVESRFGARGWLAFSAHVNAALESQGQKPVSASAVQNWLFDENRQPPKRVASLLPLIDARLANPEKPRLYQITIALSEAEDKALKRAAKRAHQSPEQMLQLCTRIGMEEELGIEL